MLFSVSFDEYGVLFVYVHESCICCSTLPSQTCVGHVRHMVEAYLSRFLFVNVGFFLCMSISLVYVALLSCLKHVWAMSDTHG